MTIPLISKIVNDPSQSSEVLNYQSPLITRYDHAQLVNVLAELQKSDASFTEISRKYEISTADLNRLSCLYVGISPTQIAHLQSITYHQKDYCPEQIVAILAVLKRPRVSCAQVSREYKFNKKTLYHWRQNYANKSVEEVRTLRLARQRLPRYSADKIFAFLQEFVSSEMSQDQICLKHGVSRPTANSWRQKYLNKSIAEIAQLQVEARPNRRVSVTTVAPIARFIPQNGVDVATQQSRQVYEGGQGLLLDTPRLLRNYQQPPTLMRKPGNAPAQGKSTPPAAASETTSASGLTFMSFINSLATNALAAMVPLPPEAQAQGITVSLPLAREYIDIITMLQERTRGNLREEEEQGLQRFSGDLEFQYAECQKSQNSSPPAR